jgi:hypothetical protein
MAHEHAKGDGIGGAERDLAQALDRLVAGTPTHPMLKKLASKGKLRINCSTVAKEARRSRTLIGHDRCAYPAIRMRVLEHMKPVAQPRDSAAVIVKLREQVAELRLLLKNAQEQTAIHLLRRQKAEQEVARWRRAYERMAKKNAEAPHDGTVVPLPGVFCDRDAESQK